MAASVCADLSVIAHVKPNQKLNARVSLRPTVALGADLLRERYEMALASGLDRREALRLASRECGMSRKEAYRILKTD